MAMAALRCSVRYFCFGAFLIFAGSVMMCAFGFTIVLPFMVTLHWPLGECRVVNGSLNIEHCSCNKKISQYDRCIARYPCLQVYITLHPVSAVPPSPGQEVPSFLHSNTSYTAVRTASVGDVIMGTSGGSPRHELPSNSTAILLYRNWRDIYQRSCTLYECGAEEWNHNQVNRFLETWGQKNTSYLCYYNPQNETQVILARMPASYALHALLWPSLCLLIGGLLWLGLCVGCWKIDTGQNGDAAPPITNRKH